MRRRSSRLRAIWELSDRALRSRSQRVHLANNARVERRCQPGVKILQELKETQRNVAEAVKREKMPANSSAFDVVRRKYLAGLTRLTGRPAILYASNWTAPNPDISPDLLSIIIEDVHGLMEVMHGLPEGPVDLIIHSPGGSPEAAEGMVTYLRSRFSDIRVFVPHAAMSAATMLSCAANRIVMGKHSFLGPIDPQFIIQTELGRRLVPAHAIEAQFAQAKKEIEEKSATLPAWLPILRQYGPSLLVQCRLARELSDALVGKWLDEYMFKDADGNPSGPDIARRLADHEEFKSHSRFIDRNKAREFGLIVEDLEIDQKLQDAVLSIFHATAHTFNGTPAVKLIENHLGMAYVKQHQVQQIQVPFPIPSQAPPPMPRPEIRRPR